ncbi:MAG: aminodeoxychorismate synthase component I [Armatimonadota bacterium]
MLMCKQSDINNGFVLIDDYSVESKSGKTYIFKEPKHTIISTSMQEIESSLKPVQKFLEKGYYLAGFLCYDIGLFLDKVIIPTYKTDIPQLWFGVFDGVEVLEYDNSMFECWDDVSKIQNIQLNISPQRYMHNVEIIKEYIKSGDIYQANYTCKLLFENHGSAFGLFSRLRKAHPVCHSAFIKVDDFCILSLSPELFFRKQNNLIQTKPMKGTIKRGLTYQEDLFFSEKLKKSEKDKAENVMIVDLMRNDIGKICNYGSVNVLSLFDIEKYNSLYQMTSLVEGKLKDKISIYEILKSIFPAGSVTGAPKLRAMEIINELEIDSRGIYCGSIGMIEPNGNMLFNVAIRTIFQKGIYCELGIGSGIVADSNPKKEYNEILLKSDFLKQTPLDFKILETLLFTKSKGYKFLHEHLTRMKQTAEYFNYTFDYYNTHKILEEFQNQINSDKARVRILLFNDGDLNCEWYPIENEQSPKAILLLSNTKINPDNIFLYHKTTNRTQYDNDLKAAREKGYYDVIYLNNRNEVTECAVSNVMIKVNNINYTPPVSSGLLAGIYRDNLLKKNRIIEKTIVLDDLLNASDIIVFNSVRGEIEIDSIVDEYGNIIWHNKSSIKS